MKRTLLILIALSALAAACHERRSDPPPDFDGARARSAAAHQDLDGQGR
ncbi:MAG: hypothetical protein KGL74_13270 [Elusimicrobia bacterium]|nr:hypothetical protein [Elusimicrobiota bacterium]MDE2512088.1 hypothetical protein [Elusimicrobiota bacterium]